MCRAVVVFGPWEDLGHATQDLLTIGKACSKVLQIKLDMPQSESEIRLIGRVVAQQTKKCYIELWHVQLVL